MYKRQEKNPFRYALFVSFFPQLVQGPISRWNDLKKSLLESHAFSWINIQYGFERILWGYFKKMVIADRAAIGLATIQSDVSVYYRAYAFVGMLLYAIDLYADFTGGIDITIGVAQMFGITLPENFRRPFFSKSIAEYWRRWHITLGTWMKDYIFYPMSLSKKMNKFGKWGKKHFGNTFGRTLPICFANIVIFFIVGIWHGAAWKYIAYGLYNGFIIAISNLLEPVYKKLLNKFHINATSRGWTLWQIIRTFILVNISWYFDNAATLTDAFRLMGNTFKHASFSMDAVVKMFGSQLDLIILLAGCLVWLIISILKEKGIVIREALDRKPLIIRWAVYIALVMSVAMLGYISNTSGGFMYAQF